MTRRDRIARLLGTTALLLTAAWPAATLEAGGDQPETVVITLRAKAGAADALAKTIARHWQTANRLNLVSADVPHVTLRAEDADGRACFVEILTWRDASVPDAAPQEIQAIWAEMNALVEARGGQPGLEIRPMRALP
jgi:hypothetical protein